MPPGIYEKGIGNRSRSRERHCSTPFIMPYPCPLVPQTSTEMRRAASNRRHMADAVTVPVHFIPLVLLRHVATAVVVPGHTSRRPLSTFFGVVLAGESKVRFCQNGIAKFSAFGEVSRRLSSAQRLSASTNERPLGASSPREGGFVLNAFRHQRTNDGQRGAEPIATGKGAQRLSASTNERPPRRPRIRDGSWSCSTPFGINERTTPQHVGSVVRDIMCSTPFGINERTTGAASLAMKPSSMCSTPFGINERTTSEASPNDSPTFGCSTPFGINERTTRVWGAAAVRGLVCSTPFGINERTTATHGLCRRESKGAQRLSASTNERQRGIVGELARLGCSTPFGINERTTLYADMGRKAFASAQRLSASTNERPVSGSRPRQRPPDVLNAFRHQRTNDEVDFAERDVNFRVLNAFRHQRTNDPTG